ncbi:uracil-DNA glycosylase [Janthinobacterium agaricidamnosum]|uniref:Type-4 uracil-DNA glycosylase n=1 Tax=Janthinobacterium agaricidamnosum NBRC 102515 = DSM 9628 TaxID=1349767 RepID=W0V7N3_9BURK|nr:uracil-DNA glycosylase [Janthinobacterium agaricidamnosum]CDG83886.1 uracil-DNA glycosylase, 4 family protein [Janthinobacterium agaricidamnosum NBRC 102515 = DSM 9628]
MSLHSGRSVVFLEEMGVGPLWRLRHGAVELDAPVVEPVASVVDAVAVVAVVAEVVEVAEAVAVQSVATPEPEPVAAAIVEAPAALADDASTAWFDDAPAPPPLAPVSAAAIAAMDWLELKSAAAKCTRCELCRGRKGSVFGRGDQHAEWLVVGSAPNRTDERDTRPLTGEAGQLLDNMLLAIGLQPDANVYVTNLVKCRPVDASGAERVPTEQEVAACRPYLEREIALTRGRTMLTLGQAAAAGLMSSPAPARGKVRHLGAVAVIATYHPDDMMGKAAPKARAWGDLCLARNTHAASHAATNADPG